MISELFHETEHWFGRRPSWFWAENKSGTFVGTDRREKRYLNFTWIKASFMQVQLRLLLC